jgi:PPOX class probable F420-dependent enzyme
MSREPQDATLGTGVEPGPLSEEEQAEFFNRPLIARLATIREDGYPFIAPLWFQWDGKSFWFVVREKAYFMPNLLREPRVCISIATDTPPYARATITGRAQIVGRPRESEEWKETARQMTQRYVGDVDPGYYARTERYPRWLIQVVPEEMTTWRGGGWHRRYIEELL